MWHTHLVIGKKCALCIILQCQIFCMCSFHLFQYNNLKLIVLCSLFFVLLYLFVLLMRPHQEKFGYKSDSCVTNVQNVCLLTCQILNFITKTSSSSSIFQMQLFQFTIWEPFFQMVTYSIEKLPNGIIIYFRSNTGNNCFHFVAKMRSVHHIQCCQLPYLVIS